MAIWPKVGLPGFGAEKTATKRIVFKNYSPSFLPGGMYIDGTLTRDPGNTPDVSRIRAGTVFGRVTSSGYYAPSVIGTSTGSLTNTGTTITVSAAEATELVRRVGATGTFKFTGPPTTAGTVRSLTATYSAVNTTTGAITITALGVDEVQTVNFNIAATGGSVVLRVPKANGQFATTTPISWSATDATFLSNINSALDTATGVSGGIVATAIASTDTDLGFVLTFSGTGYACLPQPTEMVSVETLPTSSTAYNVVRTTTGVDGRFVTASLVQPTDGSETPVTFLPDGFPMLVTEVDGTAVSVVEFPQLPISALVDSSQLLPWPADASTRTWLINSLKTYGTYVFDNMF